VADLLSERTTMRVWWRGAQDNRVDVVTASGETGVHTDRTGSWTWNFEADTATRADPSPLDLPAPPDLLPSSLGRRLLSEAQDRELSRIGARRVAGRDALGVRLVPAAAASSVRAVDVWVDRASGLPLEVEVSARSGGPTALDTRFLDLRLGRPAASVTAFSPPPGASVRHSGTADVLSEAGRRLRSAVLPATLAGLSRRGITGAPEGVGLYGSGVTLLAVAPVPFRLAAGLRGTLSVAPGAVSDQQGIRVSVGPLGLMLVDPPFGGPYVLTGTVTLDALASAAAQLPEARR
jgi:outer membrane lipoprotein-sorting protein